MNKTKAYEVITVYRKKSILSDEDDFDLYDLYYFLKTPHTVRFRYRNKIYEVKSEETEENVAIQFGSRWYRTLGDFFNDAAVGNNKVITLDEELYGFEVVK